MGDYPLTDWDSQAKLVQMTGMPLSSRFFLRLHMPSKHSNATNKWEKSENLGLFPIKSGQTHLLTAFVAMPH